MADAQPLVKDDYFADPSGRVFNNKLYIYGSHDRKTDIPDDDNGSQYDMADYHVLSMDDIGGPVTTHDVAFRVADVEWAAKQLWAPDCGYKNGKYYFFFPARDHDGVFRIGVAISDQPEGPFIPEKSPIPGSYSIDPAVFIDDDSQAYLYFGGIWGGQLQCWQSGQYNADAYHTMEATGDEPAIMPRYATLSQDMKTFVGSVQELVINDEDGKPVHASKHDRRFFEAAWMHRRGNKYYFSYSTGDTHYIVYAMSDSPTGPFTYAGRILEPVQGWTTHHSIVEFKDKWWLCYHDTSISGKNHLRSAKIRELVYDDEGRISLAKPQSLQSA
ncbi:glycoside hydrolase family 43 protein [Cercospora zeae-maydis SCOH1-5]|uniref:Glycoside hydrolase family 43 protein n=1 Tax=Cercospora zeae-maydis SCOH1-5 TaxID=717836 RepID=A0A6A6F235_9PEZI|nr:glycoside hydrolase family 43 protein [Cercospora zeae-maydis SCOH1-5]